jgi:hypothetical protein
VPSDFHPHWHINRPLSDIEYVPPTPVILDPIDRHLRRTQETERRAHARANNRLRLAQTGRILSQFEQRQGALRHCSACTEPRHDRQACGGCRSTGHIRSNCPHVPRARPVLNVQNTAPSTASAVTNVGALGEAGEQYLQSASTQFGLGLELGGLGWHQ